MLDDKIIVGISGCKQAGKSSLAEYLKCWCADYNNDVAAIYSFADSLKNCCIDILGLTQGQCYGSNEDKNSLTQYKWDNLPLNIREKYSYQIPVPVAVSYEPVILRDGFMSARDLMQVWGTDIMRKMFSDTIWVNAAFRNISKSSCRIVFIPDVRFVSEVNAIMNLSKSYIIRLNRKMFDDTHPSETELDNFDFSEFGDRVLVVDNQNMSIGEKNNVVLPYFCKLSLS